MMSQRRVNIASEIIGAGDAMLNTAWLTTSAFVALTPIFQASTTERSRNAATGAQM
jgi:hypothetical protein